MFRPGVARYAMRGAAAAALLLAGAWLPAEAADPAAAGAFDASGMAAIPEVTVEAPARPDSGASAGAAFVAGAGLKQYAMSNRQLGAIRGGMEWNGASFSFAFEQVTTVDGVVVSGILEQNGAASAYENMTNPVGSCSPSCSTGTSVTFSVTNGTVSPLSSSPGWTANTSFTPGTPIIGTANNGQTIISTTLGPDGTINSITNTANGQLINQSTVLSVGVTGLAQSIAAEQAVHSIINSLTHAIGVP